MVKKQEQSQLSETLNQSETFFMKHKGAILCCILLFVIVVAGIICYFTFIANPREDKASTQLGAAQELFQNEQYELALKGDSTGVAGFLKVASEYSGTDAGNLANLYAGLCYAGLEKWDEAVKYLEEFNPQDDAMISPAGISALGNAYAHIGKLDKAVSTLIKAADDADKKGNEGVNNSLAPTFRLQAAKILESQGKKDDALEIYQEIKEKYVASALVQTQEIDEYIERCSLK